MNPDYEKQLEAEIGRELNGLPELAAPAALVPRVLRTIEQRNRLPWYRRSWQSWPMSLQAASFVMLLTVFGGLCLGGGKAVRAEAAVRLLQSAGEWLAGGKAVVNTFGVLANAAGQAVHSLGPGCIALLLILAGTGYVLSLGLGTVFFRLAFAKNRRSTL
jgi:hypothetical protein